MCEHDVQVLSAAPLPASTLPPCLLQVLVNLLEKGGHALLADISLLVLDEAHHCT